jgi:hypothetical protein
MLAKNRAEASAPPPQYRPSKVFNDDKNPKASTLDARSQNR